VAIGSVALGIVLAVGFLSLVVGVPVLIYNGLVRLRNNVAKAWANIDVVLKQRSDEVPNLVSVVKGYAAHERAALQAVVDARAAGAAAARVEAKAEASATLTNALGALFAVAERYPDLKADQGYLALQRRLTALENEIAERREFYNDSVTAYNSRIKTLPDSLVARAAGLAEPQPLFVAAASDKDLPTIEA
jgi:LemA protein